MGAALLRGSVAGAVEEPEPGRAYRVTIRRREELKPGKGAVFAGFENGPVKHIKSPPHISEECAVANDF